MRKGITLILLLWAMTAHCFANDILAERDGYQLTQSDINNMLSAAEHIADQAFTPEEKHQLQAWALELFRTEKNLAGVASAFDKYRRYEEQAHAQTDPDIQAMIWHHLYREMVFKWQFPRYRENQPTLFDVIQRYNPVKTRLDKEQLLLAAKDPVLAEQGDYFMSQPLQTVLRVLAEFLARNSLSAEQREGLTAWALADFKTKPEHASLAYARFLDEAMPQILSPVSRQAQARYQAALYQDYYFLFHQDELAQKWPTDLMGVVTAYNPPLIVDEQHHLLISQAELDDSVATARFFADQLQLDLDTSPAYREALRQQLIVRFMERENPERSIVDSAYMLRGQDYWAQLSPTEQQRLGAAIRQSWQQSGDIWQALRPLFSELDAVIQAENQQQMLEQQIMYGVLMQQLQLNQRIFNRTMQTYRAHGDMISQSISDMSTIHSLGITGERILEQHPDHFLVEGTDGTQYTITR
ncbi:MAG: hypothetical protein R3F02_06785 [Thiolinea sp.]